MLDERTVRGRSHAERIELAGAQLTSKVLEYMNLPACRTDAAPTFEDRRNRLAGTRWEP